MSFNPDATKLSGMTDVSLSNPQSSHTLTYSDDTQKWSNQSISTSTVSGLQSTLDDKLDKTTVTGFGAGTSLPPSAPDGTVFFLYEEEG